MDRIILHCDMNSFYASVELLEHPELADAPVAVAGDPDGRHGIILAKNEKAKKYGVKTAETIWQARKKCPELVTLPPHHDKYHSMSIEINRIYLDYTDLVEPFSIDESWLDVSGSANLFGSGKDIADSIRDRVREELGLTLSAGVSFNKVFAKMGSDYKKPDATTVIDRNNYRKLLWPMPVGEMFFCGSSTANKLNDSGIYTIGDLANADTGYLKALLGKHGEQLYIYANGLDDAPVLPYSSERDIKSVGHGNTFRADISSDEEIKKELIALSDTVATRLRRYHLKAGGVKVDIKDSGLKSISRQEKLITPTDSAREMADTAFRIIKKNWDNEKPIRMLTVTAISLVSENEGIQMSMFDIPKETNENLEKAMDDIRSRFGKDAITFGKK